MTSSQPRAATATISHRMSVMRLSRVRTQEPGPSITPSANTPRRTAMSATSSRAAPSMPCTGSPTRPTITWNAASSASAAMTGAMRIAASRA